MPSPETWGRYVECPFCKNGIPWEQTGQHLVSCMGAPWWVRPRDGFRIKESP